MRSDPLAELGGFLTATEAERLAVQFDASRHTVGALGEIAVSRRETIKKLLGAAGLGHADLARTVSVLRAIVGAKAVLRELTPVWTMPGNEASVGHLTGELHRIVRVARQSITAATYNFRAWQMWGVLKEASEQRGVVVTVYVDAGVGDGAEVKAQLPRATVYRSASLPNGRRVLSHAKFIVIDHELLLLTSANFSYSAENLNVELGILIRDSALAESIELTMTSKHGAL